MYLIKRILNYWSGNTRNFEVQPCQSDKNKRKYITVDYAEMAEVVKARV